ncbi:MAG: energy transducer TonB [Thermoanaerobaculia bacterium]
MNRSLLGLEKAGAEDKAAPITRSFLGLEAPARTAPPSLDPSAVPAPPARASVPPLAGQNAPAPSGGPAVPTFGGGRRAGPPSIPVPELEREIFALEKSDRARAFPVERAILFSLALHLVFLLLILYAPTSTPGSHSLFPGMTARPRSEEDKIPIVFRAAPGPERENRKPSDFSDKNRRAGGGDRSKPRSSTPFAPVLPGKEGLAPGSASRMASAPSGSRGGQSRTGESGAPAERSATGMTPPDALRNPAGASSGSGAASGTGASASRLANLDSVIQEAARSQVGRPGEHGAGIPNPDGGYMDSGPLSFETSWYDWGPYADEMVRRIKLHWDVPKLAELGWKGKLTIHFDIRVDGSASGATIVAGSGIPPFDYAAMQAILKSNPFRPLPKDLLKEVPGKDREGVTVTFFYNMRPGKNPTSEGM